MHRVHAHQRIGKPARCGAPTCARIGEDRPVRRDRARHIVADFLLLGRETEAERHFEQAVRAFKELGQDAEFALQLTWRKLRERPIDTRGIGARDPITAVTSPSTIPSSAPASPRKQAGALVGREPEWTRLSGLLDEVSSSGQSGVVLISGEPGLGKSRLLAAVLEQARLRGMATFEAQSFETDRSRPYAPWIELLGALRALFAPDAGRAWNRMGSRFVKTYSPP